MDDFMLTSAHSTTSSLMPHEQATSPIEVDISFTVPLRVSTSADPGPTSQAQISDTTSPTSFDINTLSFSLVSGIPNPTIDKPTPSIRTLPSSSTSPTPALSLAPPSAPSVSVDEPTLSDGQKAGIAVGAALWAVLLIAGYHSLLAWVVGRKRRARLEADRGN
jgi:hypothetical protein